jgi:hypothetical protein
MIASDRSTDSVMARHGRSKNGVASLAYVPGMTERAVRPDPITPWAKGVPPSPPKCDNGTLPRGAACC